jgi:hypothetical protein
MKQQTERPNMKTYWMSFVKNHKNVGVIITDADDEELALNKTKNLGLFPGGQAMLFEMDLGDPMAVKEIKHWGKDRLIKPEELLAENYKKIKDAPQEAQRQLGQHVTVICEECAQGVPHTQNQNQKDQA